MIYGGNILSVDCILAPGHDNIAQDVGHDRHVDNPEDFGIELHVRPF
jgi:hypothetical protein